MHEPATTTDDLVQRLDALEAETARLRLALAERAESEAGPSARPERESMRVATADAPPSGALTGIDDAVRDRRSLLRGIGVAAVAGTAAVVASASPAAAADGDPILIGRSNVQPLLAGTELRATGGQNWDRNILTVSDDSNAGVISFYPSAVSGWGLGDSVSNGVYGYCSADGGYGVVALAQGAGKGLYAAGTIANLELGADGAAPAARVEPHVVGDVVFDGGHQLWLCVASGSPGTWRLLARAGSVTALTLHDAPKRAYDSRPSDPPLTVAKGKLNAGQSRDVDLKVASGVPAQATAALLNVTCTGTSTGGFLQIYKTGAPTPASSSINWDHVGTNVANSITVALDSEQRCTVRCGGTNAATDVIIDVVGYYL